MKKEVITEVEDQNTKLKSSTQKVEDPEGGQQKKIVEDDLLKFQMQNLEDAT